MIFDTGYRHILRGKNWKQGRKSDPILKTDQNHVSKNILLKQKLSEVNQIIDRIKLNGQIPVKELKIKFLHMS